MLKRYLLISCILIAADHFIMAQNHQNEPGNALSIQKCDDFPLNGKGDHRQWSKSKWTTLSTLQTDGPRYETRFKIVYSDKGIYVLVHCEDKVLSTDYSIDQGDIWKGDVFEVFLQPYVSEPLYFEYEINALNAELVLLVPNDEGTFYGWSPWHYEGERKVQKAVHVGGENAEPGADIRYWSAEMFFPFALFRGLGNVPPAPGTIWRGNFYRMDYDNGHHQKWAWQPVDVNFHQYKRFGRLIFN
jgi:hypothetical protein